MAEQEQVVTLGYWAIRGLAEPIRLLMEYLGIKYNQERYHGYDDRDKWFVNDKPLLKTNLPNLPYLKDGDLHFSESFAIAVYLCHRANRRDLVEGTELADVARFYEAFGRLSDIRFALASTFYDPQYTELVGPVLNERVFPTLDCLEKQLEGREYIIGKLTYVDFVVYEFLELLTAHGEERLKNYPNLLALHQRIRNIPQIAEYLKSERFVERPFNNLMAQFK